MIHIKVALYLFAILFIMAYYYCTSLNSKKTDNTVVETTSGLLKGISGVSREGREFFEYLGIPYAKPPVRNLRFEPPQPFDSWEGIREASSHGSICLQADPSTRKISGDEDCLVLNVFSPKMRSNATLLPVLVWIHGGMFVVGSSKLYRPDYFMDHDVVLVTLNYRLGPLGFLNTGDGVVRGNMALKDQNMALKWVQANIKNFGGDPDQVTLFGESAGSASVHHHVLSPLSKGLFQKAISQSATSLAAWTTRSNSSFEQSRLYSKIVGCPTEDSRLMVECLKETDKFKIVDASYSDFVDDLRDPIMVFNPSVEYVNDESAFIVEHPRETLRKGNFNKIPWICGVNSDEGLMISAPLLRDSRLTELSEHYGKRNPEGLDMIKKFYFGNEAIESPKKFQNWTNIFTDLMFAAPAQRSIQLQSQHAPVYAYYYSYKGDFSLTDILVGLPGKYPQIVEYMMYFVPRWINKKVFGIKPVHHGACHFDESALLFPLNNFFYIEQTHQDYEMSKAIVNSWVSFASDSNSKSNLLQFDGVSWPMTNSDWGQPLKYMHIDVKSNLINEPNSERNKFWNNIDMDSFKRKSFL